MAIPQGNARTRQLARGPGRRCAGHGGGRCTRAFGTGLRALLPPVLPLSRRPSRRRNRSTRPTSTLQERVAPFRQHIEITSVRGWNPWGETALSKGHLEAPPVGGVTPRRGESAEPFHPSGTVEGERVPPLSGAAWGSSRRAKICTGIFPDRTFEPRESDLGCRAQSRSGSPEKSCRQNEFSVA